MANPDITRALDGALKHYAGVRLQQGRALLDSDWNADVDLTREDLRSTLVELIGCQGSFDAGFEIHGLQPSVVRTDIPGTGGATVTTYDLRARAGSFFLGGMRLQLDEDEHYLEQADWLHVDLDADRLPTPPTVAELQAEADGLRYDLVYLRAWQQPVSAVEDRELRDRGLGGPDTAMALRRMRRIHIAEDVGTDLALDAFAALFSKLETVGAASFDASTSELVSQARLSVAPSTDPGTPCAPAATPGYVGYENQAIRVELREPGFFTWGFQNAAPLHRVRVSPNDPRRLHFITQPRDGELAPRTGQIVELIPWAAELANGEKVADAQGKLFRATSSYDPKAREIRLDGDVPGEWLEWLDAHPDRLSQGDAAENRRYFFLRIWDRGDDTNSPPLISYREQPVELAGTGLEITIEPQGRLGEYWLIAARRATPDRAVPWELKSGARPDGPRNFYAPLALVRWSLGASAVAGAGSEVVGQIIDARRSLRRICERGCCTITVGDGNESKGLVNSLGDALAALPAEGGRICMLPGVHPIEDELDGLSEIEIVGCGQHTVLANRDDVTPAAAIDTQGDPLLLLTDCANITLRDFVIQADASVAIKLRGVNDQCRGVVIEGVEFEQTGSYDAGPPATFALPQAAIMALGSEDLVIRRCRVSVEDQFSYAPAVVLGGHQIRMYDCWIQAGPLEHPAAVALIKPLGGVHILSQSTDVELSRNVIRGGWGNGVTLGHVFGKDIPVSAETLTMAEIWAGGERALGEVITNQHNWSPHTEMPIATLSESGWQPGGALVDVRLDRNRIVNFGLSGIASPAFGLADTAGNPIFVVPVKLDVARNLICDCVRVNAVLTSSFAENGNGLFEFTLGGVALSAVIDAHFRENHICDNHLRDDVSPPDDDLPNCGIALISGQQVVIEDNRIIDNAIYSVPARELETGLRGGIAIEEVSRLLGYTYLDALSTDITVPTPAMNVDPSEPALLVRKNEVAQRSGKALWVRRAFGAVSVTDNVLQCYGDETPGVAIDGATFCIKDDGALTLSRAAQGACVEILGFGLGLEYSWTGGPTPTYVDPTGGTVDSGPVVFTGNQTSLDWDYDGGYATSVLISSLDSVVANDNVMVADMHHVGSYNDMREYAQDIMNNAASRSFLLYHCYLGATGSVQAVGNRIESGHYHCPYSLISAGALAPALNADLFLQFANVQAWNVGTHCIVGKIPETPGSAVEGSTENISIYKLTIGTSGLCAADSDMDFSTTTTTVDLCITHTAYVAP